MIPTFKVQDKYRGQAGFLLGKCGFCGAFVIEFVKQCDLCKRMLDWSE